MPTGPKGQKRPADVISAAVKVMRIATGQEEETPARAFNARSANAFCRVKIAEAVQSERSAIWQVST